MVVAEFMGTGNLQEKTVTKSELIEQLSKRQSQLAAKDVELAVKTMLEQMTSALSTGERIEIRGFGSFSLHFRPPRMGRNPKTGEPVPLAGKHVPHFKPGKELRERVNESLNNGNSVTETLSSTGPEEVKVSNTPEEIKKEA